MVLCIRDSYLISYMTGLSSLISSWKHFDYCLGFRWYWIKSRIQLSTYSTGSISRCSSPGLRSFHWRSELSGWLACDIAKETNKIKQLMLYFLINNSICWYHYNWCSISKLSWNQYKAQKVLHGNTIIKVLVPFSPIIISEHK